MGAAIIAASIGRIVANIETSLEKEAKNKQETKININFMEHYVVMLGRDPIEDYAKANLNILKQYTSSYEYHGTQLQPPALAIEAGEWSESDLKNYRWRNNDRRIIQWWKDKRDTMKALGVHSSTRIYFIEDDVRFDCYPENVSPAISNNEFDCHRMLNLIELKENNWKFNSEIDKLPEELRSYAAAITPLAVIGLTPTMLDDLLFYETRSDIFQKDIFCELRIGTLLNYLGYLPHFGEGLNYVRNFPFPSRPGKVSHPSKY